MLSSYLISLGLTRDSFILLWGRIVSGAALLGTGLFPLDSYVGPKWAKAITVVSIIILYFSGKYDSSPLPGKKL